MLHSGINFLTSNVQFKNGEITAVKRNENIASSFRILDEYYCYRIIEKMLINKENLDKHEHVHGQLFYPREAFKNYELIDKETFGHNYFEVSTKSTNTTVRVCYNETQNHHFKDVLTKIHEKIVKADKENSNVNVHLDLIDQSCMFTKYCQTMFNTLIFDTALKYFIPIECQDTFYNIFDLVHETVKNQKEKLEEGINRRILHFNLLSNNSLDVYHRRYIKEDYYDELVWDRNSDSDTTTRYRISPLIGNNYNFVLRDEDNGDIRLSFTVVDGDKIFISGSLVETLNEPIKILEPIFEGRKFVGAFVRDIYYSRLMYESIEKFINEFDVSDFYNNNKRNLKPNYIKKELVEVMFEIENTPFNKLF